MLSVPTLIISTLLMVFVVPALFVTGMIQPKILSWLFKRDNLDRQKIIWASVVSEIILLIFFIIALPKGSQDQDESSKVVDSAQTEQIQTRTSSQTSNPLPTKKSKSVETTEQNKTLGISC